MTKTDIRAVEIIAPNFKKRMSGVTSTVIRLVPRLSKHIAIVTSGPKLPPELPQVSPWALLFMPRRGPSGPRVWHARRNNEMLPGLFLKHVLRKRLKLLFTSAAQRDHSAYTKWLIRRMDALIATSAKSAAYLERPAKVIHHGIDTSDFVPAEDKSALRRSLSLPETGPLIGCFGRIRPQKGNDIFIDAMLKVLPRHPEATAIMMGGVTDSFRDFHADLRKKVADAELSDRVLFRPEAEDWEITSYFQALDLYIAPQRWEGFGLTPLEAMACEVPVVATRVGAFEELIEDGVTGTLVEIEDTAAIAAATDRLLSDPTTRAAWSKAARKRAVVHFDLDREAQAILGVYRELLAEDA